MLFLPGMSREKSFMDERIYEEKSLKELIDDISNPKLMLTDEKIINLIVKYFYGFRFPESTSERVKLQDIEYVFDQAHRYFRLHREKSGRNVILNSWDSAKEFTFFQDHKYATSMLWDVAATTVIVKQITKTVLKREDFDDSFLGLDLWSGSWILTLAGCLCALRNGFSNMLTIGCEREKVCSNQEKYWTISFQNKLLLEHLIRLQKPICLNFSIKKGKRSLVSLWMKTSQQRE